MTRFARAKGSKASNERKEEDPTPWHIMRQQLAEQMNKKDDDCEKKSSLAASGTNMVGFKPEEEMWSEFNEFKLKKPCFIKETKSKTLEELPKCQNEKICIKKKTNNIKVDSISINAGLNKITADPVKTNTKPQERLNKLVKDQRTESKTKNTIPKANMHSKPIEKNKLKQNKISAESFTVQTTIKTTTLEENEDEKLYNYVNMNSNTIQLNTNNIINELKTNKMDTLKDRQQKKTIPTRLAPLDTLNFDTSHTLTTPKHLISNTSTNGKKEKLSLQQANNKKGLKNKEFQSIENKNSRSIVHTIMANGRKIEIVRFEAFWIKKDDASKLKELKKKLKDQNIPNDKIKTIIKLERRKAEKALSREKTNVCYHCRKFGHKFSECPEINNSSMSKSGICFKCGSTEHTHFECKVTQSQNFRYAVCFVCNEQGHIARQCSLNPQGQYPKGGSCHLCGEVTHLRKDCPKEFEEKPSSIVTVEKINSVGLEDVGLSEMKTNNKKANLVKNKVVLF